MAGSMRLVGDKTWEFRVSAGWDPVRRKYDQRSQRFHGTEPAARKALARFVTEVADGKHTSSTGTFGALLDVWLERAELTLSPTTMVGYRRIAAKELRPALGHMPIEKLRPKHFDDLYDRLTKRGLSPASVQRVHATARRALNQAVRWEWIGANPAASAEPPAARRPDINPPSVKHLEQILRHAAAVDEDLAAMFVVASMVGGRRGELCGLRWRNLDLEAKTVKLERTIVDVNGKLVEKDTKTHQQREFELDDATVEVLAALRIRLEERARHINDGGLAVDAFVFSRSADCSTPMRPEWVTKGYARAARAAGLVERDGKTTTTHLHDLRHLNASLLLAAGVPLAEVSYRLGHAKQSTTTDVYNQMIPGRAAAAPAALKRLLGPSMASARAIPSVDACPDG